MSQKLFHLLSGMNGMMVKFHLLMTTDVERARTMSLAVIWQSFSLLEYNHFLL